MGEGGLLVELTRHLMQAAVEAETDPHLAEGTGCTGGRGSRSGVMPTTATGRGR